MGLDLWSSEDVVRILMATQETMRALGNALSPADSEVGNAYQQGFRDALGALAVAFGVAPRGGSGSRESNRLSDGTEFVDGEVLGMSVRPLDWPE
jgi:hypothetical protein